LLFFILAQFLWLAAAFAIASILGKRIIKAPDTFRRKILFGKLWLSMALNAPLGWVQILVNYMTELNAK
jgi:hypothetical protein